MSAKAINKNCAISNKKENQYEAKKTNTTADKTQKKEAVR
jgi:hypothetical protein